jgi:glycosyltransferase involved in cell wall biosynthesis
MRIIVHNNHEFVKILDEHLREVSFPKENTLGQTLFSLATAFPDRLLLWCHQAYYEDLNFKTIDEVFQYPGMMVSYSVANKKYLTEHIGYVEDSPFINVKYNVSYPTWLMSSDVGGVHAEVLSNLSLNDFLEKNFNLFLNSLAKTTMSEGLLCYSNPNLLQGSPEPKIPVEQVSAYQLFKFIKLHYKKRWVFFLFTALLFFEKKLSLFPLVNALFHKKKVVNTLVISRVEGTHNLVIPKFGAVDIIIPTIGRKKYLFDVLKDLAAQTFLPERVIIIEQNPARDTISELDYLYVLDWPFKIVHKFTHRIGVCHARNLAIALTRSPWVFFADDDNRLQPDTLEHALITLLASGARAITSSYLQKNEKKTDFTIRQWSTFGAGNSFVQGDIARSIKFDLSYEYGYGEDKDYGMKLRNIGVDVIYYPFDILHLKAPVGGFRNSIKKPWESEDILPKPSPTVMLYRKRHTTPFQLNGYRLLLFIKFYNKQHIKNPFVYIKQMRRAWENSSFWANKLDKQ